MVFKKTDGRCGACEYTRRRCRSDCSLAPYFQYAGSMKDYGIIHEFFGFRNFPRLIERVSEADHQQTIKSLVYEATARLQDPILGCVSYVLLLEQQVLELKEQVSQLQAQSKEESPKQSIKPDLDPWLNYDIEDLDHNIESPRECSNLISPTTTTPISSEISSPTHIPPVTQICTTSPWSNLVRSLQSSNNHQTSPSLLDLTTPNIISPVSRPIHTTSITPTCSCWSHLVQHSQSKKSQILLDQTKKMEVPKYPNLPPNLQASSSRTPTPSTDPYSFFTVNNLAQNSFLGLIKEMESQHVFKRKKVTRWLEPEN